MSETGGTMSLSTIPNTKRTRMVAHKETNRTDDIPGAAPKRLPAYRKPDLHGTADIVGAAPRRGRVVDPGTEPASLRVTDIPGARPKPHTFRTARVVDPMNPEYKLPSVEVRPATPPRFVRDAMRADDIPGTKPNPMHRFRVRDTIAVDDIDGARAGWKPFHKRREGPRHDPMDVRDITGVGFKSKRVVDPLAPVHKIYGMEVKDDAKSHPRPLPKARKEPQFSLLTDDIEGSRPDPMPAHLRAVGARRHYRNTNCTTDIPGAAPDTRKVAMRTKRVTDPIAPVYIGLDGLPLDGRDVPTRSILPDSSYDRRSRKPRKRAASSGRATSAAGSTATLAAKDAELAQLKARVAELEAKLPSDSAASRRSGRPPTVPPSAPRSPRAASATASRPPSTLSRSGAEAVAYTAGTPRGSSGASRPASSRRSARRSSRASARHMSGAGVRDLLSAGSEAAGGYAAVTPMPLTASSRRAPDSRASARASARVASRGGSRGSAVASRHSSRAGSHALPPRSSAGSRTITKTAGGTIVMDRGTPSSRRSARGSSGHERLVLHSRDGRPRVPVTPASRRAARELEEEIASVRALK
eukprot:PLAT5745.1.p1 GENE.PLAT5745.1~~PLAT5745.1.p1  ORF type:complete len:593 (-),score=191.24 PLAT5745.1:123-1874(-)